MNVHRTAPLARRIIGVALLALLLAQWGALLHAVTHAPLVHSFAAAAEQADAAAPGEAAEAEAHSAGSPVCQLFDHLLLAQAAGHPPLQVPDAQWSTAAPPRALWPALPQRALQAYDARGPPRA